MSRNAFVASVPATSANLGPGFDAIGIAFDLRMRAHVTPARRFSLEFAPEGEAPTHDGFETAVLHAMRRVHRSLPRVRVRVRNDIPLGKGLGSSAAARTLAIAIAMRAHEGTVRKSALAHLACALEGHPDNALAAMYGGAIVAASARAFVRVAAPPLHAAVVVPHIDLATEHARTLLPDRYDRVDAVFNGQRAALLAAALASGRLEHLHEAMRDRIHQPYRAASVPGLHHALGIQTPGLLGIALSGAGPSVIALARTPAAARRAARSAAACFSAEGVRSRIVPLACAARGLIVRTDAA